MKRDLAPQFLCSAAPLPGNGRDHQLLVHLCENILCITIFFLLPLLNTQEHTMRTRVLRSSPISTFGTLRSVSFFSSAPCFPILWLNPGLVNQSTNHRHSMCCQSVHSADLKILIFENVQVLLTGDNPWGGISVPLGRNVSRGRPRTSKWAFASHQSGSCVAESCGWRSPRK